MRSIQTFIVASLAWAAVACSGKPTPTANGDDEVRAASSVKTSCSGTVECGECVSELRAWMRALVEEGHEEVVTTRGIHPVKLLATERTTWLRPAPVIVIGRDAVIFNGEVVETTEALAQDKSPQWKIIELYDRLMSERRTACVRAKDRTQTTWEVIVQIDSATPWRVVRRVVATAEASGVDSVVFAFLKPTTVAKPSPSSIDTRIEEIEKRPTTLSDKPIPNHPLEQAYGRCKPAYDGLIATSRRDRSAIRQYLVGGLPDAIEGCQCNVEIEAVKALHWWWSGRRNSEDGAIYVGVRVPLTGERKRVPISSADTTLWSAAHKHVLDSTEQAEAFFFTHTGDKQKSAQAMPRKSESVCSGICPAPLDEQGNCDIGALASPTGTGDFSSGFDDRDVYGGLLGNEVGEMQGSWGHGAKDGGS